MLRLVSIFSAIGYASAASGTAGGTAATGGTLPSTGDAYDCTIGGKYGLGDDDGSAGIRVRVAFRGGATESGNNGDVAHASSGDSGYKFSGYNKQPTPTNSKMTSSYNATEGILTLEKRGGYVNGDDDSVTIKGPGTLYVTHLDLTPEDDNVVIDRAAGVASWKPVTLTGNYSACISMAGMESVYTDKNLAPGTKTHSSDHTTEETFKSDMCHDVLTGKVLGPAPVVIPDGDASVTFTAAADGGDADGFTLRYVYDDWYVHDASVTGDSLTVGTGDNACTVSGITGTTHSGTTPTTAPSDAYFVDEDLDKRKIMGKVYASHDSATKFKVILEKTQPAGTWGFQMGDDSILVGPKDTHGHNGADLPYYGSGGSTGTSAPNNLIESGEGDTSITRTAGGGPAGARTFNKHGDVIPGSARGMHPDYWEEEVVEVDTWIGTSPITIEKTAAAGDSLTLEKTQGSPPSPLYRFQVMACDQDACADKKRAARSMQVVDVGLEPPIGQFSGDLNPKFRVLHGQIPVRVPNFANGLQGYRAYPTANAIDNLNLKFSDDMTDDGSAEGTKNSQFQFELPLSCPPDSRNDDWEAHSDDIWDEASRAPCGNDNPYSPKCIGKSCPHIQILPGSNGEFYISRYDNTGNGENSGQRNYGANEWASIYLPKNGWLTPVSFDSSDAGDTLTLRSSPSDTAGTDVKGLPVGEYKDVAPADENDGNESMIEWSTDSAVEGRGWTLIYQPDYPLIEFPAATKQANGAMGLRLVPIFGAEGSAAFTADYAADPAPSSGSNYNTEYRWLDTENNKSPQAGVGYVETRDWLTPNVTCTPTTMHCPLPSTWAHINYTTPSLYPEPAEGSCLQQKSGTSSLAGCALEGRQWAGNCGDATSYFWFEKIACGSSRTFHTDRSLIEDFVQLTPTWEDIQAILDTYYTTKAPTVTGTSMPSFFMIDGDYHIPPVLPPKINCTCLAAMDAYASLLSVVSKTPTPGAPVTLDPEVLNTGTSKMVATLRMYQDPTYSIPASSTANMPIVVSRFYLEVSTKFTRNRITISDCTSAHVENKLNATDALKPRSDYCDNSTFDTQPERSPSGVTHMDRLSMKKFKYQGTTDVFMQCKIRACAQQPCGVCQRRQLQYGMGMNMSPQEGEMFAPPTQLRVGMQDHNAMTFAQPSGPVPMQQQYGGMQQNNMGGMMNNQMGGAQQPTPGVTTKPIEVKSEVSLSGISATWAVQNRPAIMATLRATLQLMQNEELVILGISAARRLEEANRELQASGVKIDFVIGVMDTNRAMASQSVLTQLASGQSAVVEQFSKVLDEQLVARGAVAINLPSTSVGFKQPEVSRNASVQPTMQQFGAGYGAPMQPGYGNNQYGNMGQQQNNMGQQQQSSDNDDDSSSGKTKDDASSGGMSPLLIVGLLCIGMLLGAMMVRSNMQNQRQAQPRLDGVMATHHQAPVDQNYQAKIASVEDNGYGFDENFQMQ